MKETGLMFKAPLVRAILSGQKTQTRRIAKTEITMGRDSLLAPHRGRKHADVYLLPERAKEAVALSPVGQPGDRIYVRETFARVPTVCGSDELVFAADYQDGSDKGAGVKYTPAIHMFKEDARIWLEVTGVRVERLHDICEADADAEGCERLDAERHERDWTLCPKCGGTRLHDALGGNGGVIHDCDCMQCDTYVKRFRHLWQSTGGDWDANPWVWVIDFKRIDKPAAL